MKQFHCGDVVPGSPASFLGKREEYPFAQVDQHACTDHGLKEISEALIEQVRSTPHEVASA